jgi:hypothetical protein
LRRSIRQKHISGGTDIGRNAGFYPAFFRGKKDRPQDIRGYRDIERRYGVRKGVKNMRGNSPKSNLRSFRYTDEVAAILEAQEGNSLNEKFESLVLFCFYNLEK